MLARAAEAAPGAELVPGDLRALPAPDGEFDLAVCALALSHLEDLEAGVGELARVLRPGGTLVISVLHPFQALLGWQAPFTDVEGRRGFVREHPHTHARYLAAFRSAGLAVRDCVEPELGTEEAGTKRRAHRAVPGGDGGRLRRIAGRPRLGRRETVFRKWHYLRLSGLLLRRDHG